MTHWKIFSDPYAAYYALLICGFVYVNYLFFLLYLNKKKEMREKELKDKETSIKEAQESSVKDAP
jgi:phosphotransferase system  glucose/maltose/N-acetylglucosamine-specific IIC component